MRLLISAGGTGGGVYPALSVAKTVISNWQLVTGNDAQFPVTNYQLPLTTYQLLWVGSHSGMEADLVARAGLPFRAIHGAGVHGVGWRPPLNALDLMRGLAEALGLARAFPPHVV